MTVRVVGGGIGGLTLAAALARYEIPVVVHEAATALRPVGSGLVLWPNAFEALERLGLADSLADAGADLTTLRVLAPDGHSLRTVEMTTNIEGAARGATYLPRATLQNHLVSALPDGTVRLNEECVDVSPGGADSEATLRFADGAERPAGVAVGADGIGSTVRESVVEGTPVRATGTVAYRGAARVDTDLDGETRQVWGPGTRVGVAPLGDGRTYWFATAEGHVADRERPAAVVEELRAQYGDYPEPIPAVIDRTDPAELVVTELADVAPLSRWRRGRAVLLGDAAHATLPYLGQGAAQAIEDGVALSRRVADGPVEEALESYVARRKRRTERIVRLSRLWWWVARVDGLAARIRNALVRYGPEAAARRQQRWLSRPRL